MSPQNLLRSNLATKVVFATGLVFTVIGVTNRLAIQAQSPSPQSEARSTASTARRFDVVSIKPCKGVYIGRPDEKKGGQGQPGRIRWDPKTLHAECQSLESLVRDAYLAYPDGKPWTRGAREEASTVGDSGCTACGFRFPPVSDRLLGQPIQGGPGWIDSARYTIDAKTEIPTTQEMMRGPMMQAALEERFKLRIHRETRAVQVYELTVAEGGPKLQKSQDGSCRPFNLEWFHKLPPKRIPGQTVPIPCGGVVSPRNGTTDFPGTTISGFCRNLSSLFDRDVLDKTGLGGFFDIHVDAERVMIPVDDAAAKLSGDDMSPRGSQLEGFATFRAFQAALPKIGLKLQPAKGVGVFLVIDHVERPSQN